MINIISETQNAIRIIKINRPERKNAVDFKTAEELYQEFLDFEKNSDLKSINEKEILGSSNI